MVKCVREMDDGVKICKERMGIIWLKAGIWK
jgi:hypothetical protein